MITYQLIKASSSVAANYRAVCRAKSKADFININSQCDSTLIVRDGRIIPK